ncbi:hypothetical protein [Streptomyces himalayensis]|nr:hypothetical protein [Streptomyces himalayensis]
MTAPQRHRRARIIEIVITAALVTLVVIAFGAAVYNSATNP